MKYWNITNGFLKKKYSINKMGICEFDKYKSCVKIGDEISSIDEVKCNVEEILLISSR